MKVTKVSCENCGAPLHVREDARFVTCTHCDAQLKIDRTGGAVSTIVLEAKVAEIAGEVSELRDEAKLARLDREWAEERERLMVSVKGGARVVPSESNGTLSIYAGVVGGVCMVGAAIWASSLSDAISGAIPVIFALGGVIVAAVGVSTGNGVIRKARAYAAAEAKYDKRRSRLLRRKR